jgi:hypothetical protein
MCHLAGRIGKDHDGEFQSFRLVDGHDSDAFGAFFHDWRLVRLATLRVCLDSFDEGAER